MQGSEKQIAWANKIKEKVEDIFLKIEVDYNFACSTLSYKKEPKRKIDVDSIFLATKSAYEAILKIDSAAWWIDEMKDFNILDDFEYKYKRAVKKGFAK